ncbi:MAG: hypothetical protein ABSE57_26585 [Bryobacteraceae bacterium]
MRLQKTFDVRPAAFVQVFAAGTEHLGTEVAFNRALNSASLSFPIHRDTRPGHAAPVAGQHSKGLASHGKQLRTRQSQSPAASAAGAGVRDSRIANKSRSARRQGRATGLSD